MAVGSAHAAAIDTTAVTGALTDAGTAVATVGAAVLVVYVGIKAYKMIKSAL
jgi:predicted Rossmann fold nucleotide-binding protein DprA/Smf involved in DNA uptake